VTYEQAVSWWCYDDKGIDDHDRIATIKRIGYTGVEILPVDKFQMVRDAGLKITAHGLHSPLEVGLNDPKNWESIRRQADETLLLATKYEIPHLIVFSGNRDGIDDETGKESCIKHLEMLAKDAESANVTLILELLNSRVDHPDYQCDHTAWGVDVVSAVDSPNVRLLYDIYHMQIMEGNIIQTIRDYHQWFAHYHTAGVPGRNEIDATQELNYRAICQTIQATGYTGYLVQEFFPVHDWRASLEQAYDVCDI